MTCLSQNSLETIDEFTIEDLRLGLKKILEKQKSEDLEHKEDDEDIDEDEDEDEDDGSSEGRRNLSDIIINRCHNHHHQTNNKRKKKSTI